MDSSTPGSPLRIRDAGHGSRTGIEIERCSKVVQFPEKLQVECNNFSHYDEEGFRALREGTGNNLGMGFLLGLPGHAATEGISLLQHWVGCCVAECVSPWISRGVSVCSGGLAATKLRDKIMLPLDVESVFSYTCENRSP